MLHLSNIDFRTDVQEREIPPDDLHSHRRWEPSGTTRFALELKGEIADSALNTIGMIDPLGGRTSLTLLLGMILESMNPGALTESSSGSSPRRVVLSVRPSHGVSVPSKPVAIACGSRGTIVVEISAGNMDGPMHLPLEIEVRDE
jgi:hypothetical protein